MRKAVKAERANLFARVDKETSEFVAYLSKRYDRTISAFCNEVFKEKFPVEYSSFKSLKRRQSLQKK